MNVILNPGNKQVSITDEMAIAELVSKVKSDCPEVHSPAKMAQVLATLLTQRALLFNARRTYLVGCTTIMEHHSATQISELVRNDILLFLPRFSNLHVQLVRATKDNLASAQGWKTAFNAIECEFTEFV
jgi:hypothetical protein